VIDGVSVSRPCCSVHNCFNELQTPQDRFCFAHLSLEMQCAVIGCSNPVWTGSLMCCNPNHEAAEVQHTVQGQSRFQLQEQLAHACAIRDHTTQSSPPRPGDDSSGEDLEPAQNGTAQQHRRIRAHFGRSYTHCEELVVSPCGMIHAHETFYGAEGVGSIADLLKHVFRDPHTRPSHIFYDNNCTLAQHVKDNPFFTDIGLSMDVFHFQCKHSETDTFYQENCNPAAFPELQDDNGGWYFNSSACEQVNAWFGNFHSITRGMKPVKFDFFLDEMISCQNKETLKKLLQRGNKPSVWRPVPHSR
ncbi:hypothetical protein BDN67DRAFT_915756, partial [Paxillus ammoniavirescens]